MTNNAADRYTDRNIPGLIYVAAFVAHDAEKKLIAEIDRHPWDTSLKRRVQHYGYRYDYRARSVSPLDKLGPLPAWLSEISASLMTENLVPQMPDQIIINEYMPGQGIAPHIDRVPDFEDGIASLSLGSDCVMEFSHPPSGSKHSILLARRSLIVLSGPARFEWRHGILARKSDIVGQTRIARRRRLSLTFRKLANRPR